MRVNNLQLSRTIRLCGKALVALFCVFVFLSLIERSLPGAPPNRPESATFSGKVIETMNAASYTYVLVQAGTEKKWVAAPQFNVKLGDTVAVASGMPMANYHSKTLQRDFDVVYFTGEVTVNGKRPEAAAADEALPKDHPSIGHHGATSASAPDFTGLKKAEGGKTVAEIVRSASKLKGKAVKVRGKVVKYNSMVIGKNWLHVRDGSGTEGNNDLTITTSSTAKVGDTVLVTGKVSTDRDFGAGYKYPVIIEDAQVKVE